MAGMKINTNIFGWIVLLLWAAFCFKLWRSGIKPRPNEPQGKIDRSIRIVGAVLMSVMTIYYIGYGLGLYPLLGH